MNSRLLFVVLLFLSTSAFSQMLKPYTLAFSTDKEISATAESVKSNLQSEGFEIAGEYMPANDKNRYLVIVTHQELLDAASKNGGLTGFAVTLRVAFTKEADQTVVSYTTPSYWGNAYYRDQFDGVKANYEAVSSAFEKAFGKSGNFEGTLFGSEKGLEVDKLHKYHYMMGMPYFDDVEELEDFDSYDDAVKKVDSNLKEGVENVKLVYKVNVPGKNLTLYGLALSGEDGEAKFLPIIDISNPKHTAFLPYELLINDKEAVMLHGRFRIALSFPDLTMGTFTKIMSTPGDIEDMIEKVVE